MKRVLVLFALLLVMLATPASALAQDYYFAVPEMSIDVYWNADGSTSLQYVWNFKNDASGHAIEYVDVGLPNGSYNTSTMSATVNGKKVQSITTSDYEGDGAYGVGIALGSNSIQPGQAGMVQFQAGVIKNVIYKDDEDDNYVSAVFKNSYFGNQYAHGYTNLTVTYHLPPGMGTEEPRWHEKTGLGSAPVTGLDGDGRITYAWSSSKANPYTSYTFGASFPKSYVPETAIVKPNPFAFLNHIDPGLAFGGCCAGLIVLGAVWSGISSSKRQMKYLPPRIAIEGHGIKRGLTAVEAAILMEQPLDKVLTMILFSVIKKNAVTVSQRDPLTLKAEDPLPEDLHAYETEFIKAFEQGGKEREGELRAMVVNLVKALDIKMKGFSRKESVDYYRSIMDRAWKQVEAENTPEVKSQKYEEVMEWTMLDKNYDDRTRDVFRQQPIYVPTWWGRYDPGYRPTVSAPSIGAGKVASPVATPSMPHLPGSDFAASIAGSVQNFSGKVVSNIGDFTSSVTSRTNPVPVTTSSRSGSSRGGGGSRSGGGGGRSCACACACAGCACACAGGGR